ncbi:hypothetical protein [Rhodanobacter koreensis]
MVDKRMSVSPCTVRPARGLSDGNGIDVDDSVRLACAGTIVAGPVTIGALTMTSGASAGAGG